MPDQTTEIKPEETPVEAKPLSKPKELLPLSTRGKAVKPDAILSRYGKYINDAAEMTSLDPALIISGTGHLDQAPRQRVPHCSAGPEHGDDSQTRRKRPRDTRQYQQEQR